MAATYDPTARALLFFDGDVDGPPTSPLAKDGAPLEARVVSPIGRVWIDGRTLSLDVAVPHLARVNAPETDALSASEQVYVRASRLALALVAQGHVIPSVVEENGVVCARHRAALDDDTVRAYVDALANAMPHAAHAAPATSEGPLVVWTAHALLTAFLDAAVDALVRAAARSGPFASADDDARARLPTWSLRAVDALVGDDARVLLAADSLRESAAALVARANADTTTMPAPVTEKAARKTKKTDAVAKKPAATKKTKAAAKEPVSTTEKPAATPEKPVTVAKKTVLRIATGAPR